MREELSSAVAISPHAAANDSHILDIVPGERITNGYVLAAAGERFSVSIFGFGLFKGLGVRRHLHRCGGFELNRT